MPGGGGQSPQGKGQWSDGDAGEADGEVLGVAEEVGVGRQDLRPDAGIDEDLYRLRASL